MFLLQPKTLQKNQHLFPFFFSAYHWAIPNPKSTGSKFSPQLSVCFSAPIHLYCWHHFTGTFQLSPQQNTKQSSPKPAGKVPTQATHTALSHVSTDLNIQMHNQSKRLPHISCISRGQPIIHNISLQIPHCTQGVQVFLPSLPEKDFQLYLLA